MGIPVVSFITLAMMWYGGVDYETFKTFGWETVYFVVLSLAFFRVYYSWPYWFLVFIVSWCWRCCSLMVIA